MADAPAPAGTARTGRRRASHAATSVPVRVAMVGTFDVENLGDLLFPYVAHHELTARLGAIELELFSYRAFDPPAWPLKVRPVRSLAERIGEFDLLVVGGGHLVRGDEHVAPGYLPIDAVTAHPYGLWLTPTLIALGAAVPVVWNAVGVIDSVPRSVEPVLAAALGGVDYLAVRDLGSARFVRAHRPDATPVVVPDTVFGIGALLDDGVRGEASELRGSLGIGEHYVVVQPSAILEDHRDAVEDAAAAAVASGRQVVELACGPCHHDRPGRLGLRTDTIAVREWPAPLVTAALLAEADGVVASSLHAGIIATGAGVALLRPRAAAGSKHEPLDLLPGVAELPHDGTDGELVVRFGRTEPCSEVLAHRVALAHHWDEIAARVAAPPSPAARASVAALLEDLPGLFESRELAATHERDALAAAHALALEADREAYDALAAERDGLVARAEHLELVQRRRAVQLALHVADTLDAAIRRVVGGSTGRRTGR
jgi:lipopolysaccharide transport system ATP-binding protein